MLYRLTKNLLLGFALIGLCPPMHANTTTAVPASVRPAEVPPAPLPEHSGWLAQTDISVARDIVFPPDDVAPAVAAVRVALLLPLQSDALGAAAEAVRAGFAAAHERENDGISVTVVATGDTPQDILFSYTDAVAQHDIVVGPLSRSGVAALAQSGQVSKPTIALTPPEATDADLKLPRQLLVVGLSIEDEARQVANWAGRNRKAGRAVVISTNIPWQRRAASAFAAQWEKQGRELEPIELVSYNGYLGARELVQLKEQLEFDKPGLLFAALDEKQAKQLRIAVGNEIPLYGTSQLNPFSFSDWSTAERSMEMDGIRLLDIPWQLQADHPAVMVYPRLAGNADQKPSADLERLYALGIDAYRVAREIASKRTSFELDGVTGKLKVNFDTEAPVFQRTEQQAVYRRGSVMAVTDPR
jgi:outer membrane PBP1 activator LpoA protein